MMMTSDVSLTADPGYMAIVRSYADDQAAFDRDFAHAWYKLTTRDMGPVARCVGPDVPTPQPAIPALAHADGQRCTYACRRAGRHYVCERCT